MTIVKIILFLIFLSACIPAGYQKVVIELPGFHRESADLYLPKRNSSDKQPALFLFLHGYSSNREILDLQFGLSKAASQLGLAFLMPNALKDSHGLRYWNASGTCCTPDGVEQNDLKYLSSLIDYTLANYPVDLNQVYIVGYSNGAFMAYRMICEQSDYFKGIISIAGGNYHNYKNCRPTNKVKILHIHGDKDTTINFNGGKLMYFPPHLPIPEVLNLWADWNGCTPDPRSSLYRWENCEKNSWVELVLRPGSTHYMLFGPGEMEGYLSKILGLL